jgi:hypothetical protein
LGFWRDPGKGIEALDIDAGQMSQDEIDALAVEAVESRSHVCYAVDLQATVRAVQRTAQRLNV